jgi:hypothetical protein
MVISGCSAKINVTDQNLVSSQPARDYQVLETVLNDILDPESPVNRVYVQNGGKFGNLLVHHKTSPI